MTTRPNISVLFSLRACLISAGQVAAMSILFFGLTVLAAEVRFGSLEAGRAYIAGARVLAQTPEIRGYYDPAQRAEDIYGNKSCTIATCPPLLSCKKLGTPMTTNCVCYCKIGSADDCTLP